MAEPTTAQRAEAARANMDDLVEHVDGRIVSGREATLSALSLAERHVGACDSDDFIPSDPAKVEALLTALADAQLRLGEFALTVKMAATFGDAVAATMQDADEQDLRDFEQRR